jgi:uncharacterized SAM-binding protein YcdF (DUF218 family)
MSGWKVATSRGLWIFLTLFVIGAIFVTLDLRRYWGNYQRYRVQAELGLEQLPIPAHEKEAIVVLTGDQERIPRAIELLRYRDSPFLLISGTAKGVTLKELVNQQGDAAKDIHLVWERIKIESWSGSTLENAQESAKIITAQGMNRIVLVTSDYHMGRAMRAFRQELPDMEIFSYAVSHPVRFRTMLLEYWKNFLFYYSL